MSTLIRLKATAPDDATHYLPGDEEVYECWVKKGYSMRVGVQDSWVRDTSVAAEIATGRAVEIIQIDA